MAPPSNGITFDLWSDGTGKHVGWLLSGGRLHTVDLGTGAATAVGPIAGLKGRVTDIALLPAM